MTLTVEQIDEIDKTMELILEIVSQETNWKHQCDSEPVVLNIEGVLRVRISDAIRELINEKVSEVEPHAEEDKEPAFDPHELD